MRVRGILPSDPMLHLLEVFAGKFIAVWIVPAFEILISAVETIAHEVYTRCAILCFYLQISIVGKFVGEPFFDIGDIVDKDSFATSIIVRSAEYPSYEFYIWTVKHIKTIVDNILFEIILLCQLLFFGLLAFQGFSVLGEHIADFRFVDAVFEV